MEIARAIAVMRAGARRAAGRRRVGAVTKQRAARSVDDIAALLDVDEPRELQLSISEAAVQVARPNRIRIANDAVAGIRTGHPRLTATMGAIVDVDGTTRLPGANLGEIELGEIGIIRHAAPHPAQPTHDA